MANLGYIQVVRHCNHLCGFCSNPTARYEHTFETMRELVDDFAQRGYFGVIFTGGEPTLHPELPQITRYARARGLHARLITNGSRLADAEYAAELAEAGLELVHVSVYSVRPEVEARLRGTPNTLGPAFAAVRNAHEAGLEVNVNCVINRLNADHLDENVETWLREHPYVRHFVWNNLDPSMGRAEAAAEAFTPRLADFELSLHRALQLLARHGKTFRVEKVPLCYMTEFAWASTETRKRIKGEERIVHFLDEKQTVRQTAWEHEYAEVCRHCTLVRICGGLFDRGGGYSQTELSPVFVSEEAIVRRVLQEPDEPGQALERYEDWLRRQDAGSGPARADTERAGSACSPTGTLRVGQVTERSTRLFESQARREAERAARSAQAERDAVAMTDWQGASGPDAEKDEA